MSAVRRHGVSGRAARCQRQGGTVLAVGRHGIRVATVVGVRIEWFLVPTVARVLIDVAPPLLDKRDRRRAEEHVPTRPSTRCPEDTRRPRAVGASCHPMLKAEWMPRWSSRPSSACVMNTPRSGREYGIAPRIRHPAEYSGCEYAEYRGLRRYTVGYAPSRAGWSHEHVFRF